LAGIAILGIPLYVVYVLREGYPTALNFGFSFGAITYWKVFLLGLITGLVSVGGAFSAVPFLQQSGLKGGWITASQFLQGLAISSVLPAPMVIFATFVGFLAARWLGALLITVGLFLPAFIFPLAGHTLLDVLIQSKTAGHMLDGVLAAVLATVLISALQFLAHAVTTPLTAVLYTLYLAALYLFPHPITTPMLVLVAAVAGQVLFIVS
jgi:chromate transporter